MQTGKFFYHIHKTGNRYDNLWVPGNTFRVGNAERNEFIKYYDTTRIGVHFENGPTIPMCEATEKFLKLPIETQREIFPIYLQQAKKAIKDMGTYIREAIFEEIRKEEFLSLPSRMKGIWVCDEKDISYWLDKLHAGDKDIFKVSLTGAMHRANPENLISDSFEHQMLREYARRYWNANDIESAQVHEILFQGEVFVHEQL